MAKRPAVEIPVRLKKGTAEKDVKALSKSMFKSFTDIKSAFDLAAGGLRMFGKALGSVSKLAKESVKLAMVQVESERKLMQAANMRGKFSKQQFKDLQKLNAETQNSVGIGDESLLKMQAQMAMMGVSNDELVRATRATIGLSEATGSDLNSSMRIVARTLQGNTSSLKRYGIQAKDSNEAMEMLLQNFEIAKDKGKTLSGQIKILGANFGDLQEIWGMGIAKSDRVTSGFEAINNAVRKFTTYFASAESSRAMDVWFKALIGFTAHAIDALTSLVTVHDAIVGKAPAGVRREQIYERMRGKFSKSQFFEKTEFDPVTGQPSKAGQVDWALVNQMAREFALKQVPLTFTEVAQSFADELHAVSKKKFVPGGRAIAAGKDKGKGGAGSGKAGKGISFKDPFNDEAVEKRIEDRATEKRLAELDQWFAFREAKRARDKEFNDAELAQTQQFYDQLATIGLNGIGSMIGNLVAAGLSGEKSLSEVMGSMFGAMLSQVGSMLVSMGTATVMAATASTPVPMLWGLTGGPAGISAGLGLIAAGGVLTGVGQYVSSSGAATKAELTRTEGAARRMAPGSAADTGRAASPTERTTTTYNINFNGALPGSERRIAKEVRRILDGNFSPAGAY